MSRHALFLKGAVHENVLFPTSASHPSERADSFCWQSVNHQVAFSWPYRA